jgi:predicted dehydrogenase
MLDGWRRRITAGEQADFWNPTRAHQVASRPQREPVRVSSDALGGGVAPVRFGIVGYGFGARYFHAPLIASGVGCELVAVATRSAERRALVAREHPGTVMADDLPGLVAAGAEAVTVSTPADTHIPLCRQALELGLPVVVDKPFALTAADARTAVELAERLGVPLTVYQNRRWDSDFRTVRALADGGTLGTITRFESRFERRQDGPPAAGGGTLLDFGSHLVDQALQLLGPVRTVYAEMHHRDDPARLDGPARVDDPPGLDDDVFIALTHTGGAHSHLWGSWVQSAPGPRFRVTGTDASYVVDGLDIQEELLVAGRTPASEGDSWGAEPPDRWGRLHDGSGTVPVPTERGRWDTYYPAFAAAVRGSGPVPVDPRDALATAGVLDAAWTSATHHTLVDLLPP